MKKGAKMELKEQFRKEYFAKANEAGYKVSGQFFISMEKDLYIEWLETKLQNTSSNSDYAKCKSIGCQFYDEKMEFNCCANESLCEKCINSQHFA